MEVKEFDKLMREELLPSCIKIMESKGLSYSGTEDKFGNFKRCAKLSGMSPKQVWFVYFIKHFDALTSFLRGEYTDSEPIEGRIVDLINYLMLLYGIVREEKGDGKL